MMTLFPLSKIKLPTIASACVCSLLILALTPRAMVAQEATTPAPESTPPVVEAPAEKQAIENNIVPPNLPGRKLQNVKELLELLGVDASQWRNFYQDRPFDAGDEEYINRILVRMPRVGREWMHRHSRKDWKTESLIDTPREFQGETFFLKGRAVKLEKIPLVAELLDRYDFTHHYRVTIELTEPKAKAVVCLTEIPFAWPPEGELNEPVEVHGVFVKLAPQEDGSHWYYFVSDHITWLPQAADEKHGITPEILSLVEQGFDASTLHVIQGKGIGPLSEQENEVFYQMQAAVTKLPATSPFLANPEELSIIECLAKPTLQHGRFVSVQGSVRRIERIEIESSDVRTRFGIDHYHVLYVFVPLHDERIKWARSANDPEPRVFDNFFPVTVCVTQLPAGMKPAPDVRIPVRVQGVMFKVWSYIPQGAGKDLVQPSPMLFGANLEVLPPVVPSSHFSNVVFCIVLAGVLGLVWLVWYQMKNESSTKRPASENVSFDTETHQASSD
jgi:hypothetical protein